MQFTHATLKPPKFIYTNRYYIFFPTFELINNDSHDDFESPLHALPAVRAQATTASLRFVPLYAHKIFI